MNRSVSSLLAVVLFLGSGPVFAYQFPQSKTKDSLPPEVTELNKISRGVSAIAARTTGALVFISVAKTVKGMPLHMVDPFDFFFRGMPPGRGGAPREMPKQKGIGSGFIVDLDKGYIMTNNHVIDGADEINLKFANGKVYDGIVVGRDANTDVAMVKIKNEKFDRTKLTALTFANSDSVKPGDFVVALGAPFGLEASISFGVVSAVGRGSAGITRLGNFIQTDAAINPGNSGGPLLDTEGRVIGVNTAIFSQSGSYAGIGFAVPSNVAMTIGERLINHGKVARGYLGVGLQDLDQELAESLKLPRDQRGALVSQVTKDSPAAKAGLRDGDVIVEIDGKTAATSDEVATRVGLIGPGKSVNLGLFRDGTKKSLSVKLGEFPDEEQLVAENSRGSGDVGVFGMQLSRLDRQHKARFNLQSPSGLVVSEIAPDSPAARAGIRVGDLIVSVNNQKITSVDDFKKASKGRRVLVRLEREGSFYYTSLKK